MTTTSLTLEAARQRLRQLGLYGLLARAETLMHEPWFTRVLEIEETERACRSLKRRLDDARLGAFKPIADFDWYDQHRDEPRTRTRQILDIFMSVLPEAKTSGVTELKHAV